MFLEFDSFSNLEYLAGFTTVAGLKSWLLALAINESPESVKYDTG